LGAQVLGQGAVSARWRMGNGSILQIDLNLSPATLHHPASITELFSTSSDPGSLTPFCARVSLTPGDTSSPVGEHP
ncbi:DUF3459 domain-containing protein, partial [Salmonella enterica]|uniref:DUF3459 domain-containing protein n=1 Tax=Salmonella enterica TaxID=28901 RepID=UPI0022B6186C